MAQRYSKVLVIAIAFLAFTVATDSVYKKVELDINDLYSNSVPVYAPGDTPLKGGNAYFSSSVTLTRKTSNFENSSSLEAIFFHSDAASYLGNKSDYLCCWDGAIKDGVCSNPGKLVLDPAAFGSGIFWYWDLNNGTTVQLDQKIDITKSGVWTFYIINCGLTDDQKQSDDTTYFLNGEVIFMNPYGHLPGSLIGSLPLFFILVFGYIVFGIIWAFLSVRYRKDLMALQNVIAAVIVIGFLENLIYGMDYAIYNKTGHIELGFNIVEAILTTCKQTIAFATLLLVTIGFTIYRPELEKKKKIPLIVVIVLYFCLCLIYEFIDTLRYTPATEYLNIPESAELVFLIPTTILDFVILFWIFWELFWTLTYLKDKNQSEKFSMFKKLGIVLALAYFISFIFFVIEVGAQLGNDYDSWWRGWWVFDGYWPCLHFALLVIIGVMWRPSANNARYAFSAQLQEDAAGGEEEMHQVQL